MSQGGALRARLARAGQEFLADHAESLEAAGRARLTAQIEALDLELVVALRAGRGLAAAPGGELAPMACVPLSERGPASRAGAAGRAALAAGKVAFLLIAGGQASRLRRDGPKGTFPIGPRSRRSLFQVLLEHVVRAGRTNPPPPLAVTSSLTTEAATRAFFERQSCFGLDRDRLHFVCQPSLPALDANGDLILAAPDLLAVSPDGHGGAVTAVARTGLLETWQEQGIELVCTFQVDNPLLRVVDEDFLGRLLTGRAPVATKIVRKTDPEERVGVVVRTGAGPAIVEYSEIGPEAARRDPDGQLTYRLGSIAVHAFRIDFLRRALRAELPLHAAHKQIACVDGQGRTRQRTAVKFERFLFDLFPRAGDLTVVEVDREREYAPLKNAEGADSPGTVRSALEREYRRWYHEAGLPPPPPGPVEISPLDATGPRDLREP